jgi:hypothetical protein
MSFALHTERGDKVLAMGPMDDLEWFNETNNRLKRDHGNNNVWFDRDYTNRRILFCTHGDKK